MATKQENKKRMHPLMWTVVGLVAASFVLLFVAALLPPQGEVHPSILKGLAIISIDIALVNFAYAVVSGKTATFTHGKTTATVKGSKQAK